MTTLYISWIAAINTAHFIFIWKGSFMSEPELLVLVNIASDRICNVFTYHLSTIMLSYHCNLLNSAKSEMLKCTFHIRLINIVYMSTVLTLLPWSTHMNTKYCTILHGYKYSLTTTDMEFNHAWPMKTILLAQMHKQCDSMHGCILNLIAPIWCH